MAKDREFAGFEPIGRLYRVGPRSVSAARRKTAPGKARFAIHRLEPREPDGTTGPWSQEEAEAVIARFRQRAEVQRRAADAGLGWAPVHAIEATAGGAAFVSDAYPRSAQKIARLRTRIDERGLYNVAASVAEALMTMRRALGRGHGCLRSAKVLVGPGPLARAKIVLTGPAEAYSPPVRHDFHFHIEDGNHSPAAPDPAAGGKPSPADWEAADLHGLGTVLFELVLQRPYEPRRGWPITPSSAWAVLGRTGLKWQQLCQDLLDDHSPARVVRLTQLENRLVELRPSRSIVPLWVGAAAVVLSASVGIVYIAEKRPAIAVVAPAPKPDTRISSTTDAVVPSDDIVRPLIVDPRSAWNEDLAAARASRDNLKACLAADPTAPAALTQAANDLVAEVAAAEIQVKDLGDDPWPTAAEGLQIIKSKVNSAGTEVTTLKNTVSRSQSIFASFYQNWLKEAAGVNRVAADSPIAVDKAWVMGRDRILHRIPDGKLDRSAPTAETQRKAEQRQQQIQLLTAQQNRVRDDIKAFAPSTDAYNQLLMKLDERQTEIEKLQAEVRELGAQSDQQRKGLEQCLLLAASTRPVFQGLHDRLAKLPAELPAWDPGTAVAWRSAAGRAWATRRDKAMAGAADQFIAACVDGPKSKSDAEASWAAEVLKAQQWRNATESVANVLDTVQSQLAMLYPPGQAGGRSLADLCKDVDGSLKEVPELNDAASDLRKRAGDVLSVSVMDRARLSSAIGNADPAVAWAAWRRLGEVALVWPKTPDELRQEAAAEKELQAKLAGLPQTRAGDLKKELAGGWLTRYATALSQAFSAKDENVAEVLGQRRPDQSDSDLPAELRYDLKLYTLKQGLGRLKEGDGDGARSLAKAFVADVWREGLDKYPNVVGLTMELKRIAESQPKLVQPETLPSPAEGGPAGWKKSVDPDGARVVFSKDNPERKLEFLLVQPKGEQPAYLCTTEVSVNLFADIIDAREIQAKAKPGVHSGPWAVMLALLPEASKLSRDDPGPMAWKHAEDGRFILSEKWLREPPLTQLTQADLYPGNWKVPKATGDCPMEYLPWEAATKFAALAHCRLPKASEWQAAYQSLPAAEQQLNTDNWNLRDQILTVEDNHLSQLRLNAPWRALPSRARFTPTPVATNTIYPGAGQHPVWFEPVDADKHAFHDLVGNVAEYVLGADEKPAVIGGSKLSPPELKVDQAYPFDPAAAPAGFADVGLRLVLDADAGGIARTPAGEAGAEKVDGARAEAAKVVQKAAYLSPPVR